MVGTRRMKGELRRQSDERWDDVGKPVLVDQLLE